MSKEVPCRLFVILATEAPVGAIFRRGPSKWVQIIKWNTDADTFEFGQWFHGRIYEEQSDLSPDGTKLLYLAAKYTNQDENVGAVWTAVSKLPYLTALALFAHKSFGTLEGGGLFVSNDEIWIDASPAPGIDTFIPNQGRCPAELKVLAGQTTNASAFRLKRRVQSKGWKNGEKPRPAAGLSSNSRFSLIRRGGSRGFAIRNQKHDHLTSLFGAVWADWDQQGRLVYAREGKLFAAEVDESDELNAQEIADFNANTPQPKQTPDWAKAW